MLLLLLGDTTRQIDRLEINPQFAYRGKNKPINFQPLRKQGKANYYYTQEAILLSALEWAKSKGSVL